MHNIIKKPVPVLFSLALALIVPTFAQYAIAAPSAASVRANTQLGSQTVFTSSESIRFAQIALRDRGYYNGPINGQMTMATRSAIRNFQRDRNIAVTGEINLRTARELGIADEGGLEGASIEIMNARAERVGTDSIRIFVDVETRGLGWRIFANQFVSGDSLHIYVRGVPPRGMSGTAIQRTPFSQTFTGMTNVRQVVFHGPQKDITINLTAGGGGGGGDLDLGNARQIAFLANRLLNSYQRDINVRSSRGQVVFDTRRDLRQAEVDLLLQLHALKAATDVYSQVASATPNMEVMRGAADSLIRQLRITNRLMNRSGNITISNIVRNDWDQLRAEIRSIRGIDNDLDRDFDR